MSRACDLVSEVEYWHLVNSIASESTARVSSLPGVTATQAPLDDAATLARAKKEAREFRSASKLPVFTSLVEASAMRFLGSAILHRADGVQSDANAGGVAADFLSGSMRYVYGGRGIERKATLDGIAKSLSGSLDDVLVSGAHFRAAFDAKFWPAAALAHADKWRAALRCSAADAQAWSAFFYTVGACGATVEDPQFVSNVVRKVAGFDGVHGAANTPALEALVASINCTAATYTNQDLDVATQATLLQSTSMHDKSNEENPHLI